MSNEVEQRRRDAESRAVERERAAGLRVEAKQRRADAAAGVREEMQRRRAARMVEG